MSIQITAKMRKKAYQGFFIVTIISLAGVPALFKLVFNTGQAVAVIDGVAVSPHDYQAAIMKKENQLAAIRAQFKGASPQLQDELLRSFGINTNVREAALEDLIQDSLLSSVARKLHIHLHADYVAQSLRNPYLVYQLVGDMVPYQLFSEQGINAEGLKVFLQRQGKTIESFDQVIEEKMERGLVTNLIKEAAIISSADTQAARAQKYSPKTFAITMANYAHYRKAEEKNQPTAQEIQVFYTTHNGSTQRYWAPEKRHGTVWTFKASGFGVPAKEFEERFMRDVRAVQGAPAASFGTFASQKQGTKQAVTTTSKSQETKAHKALFNLTQGRRTAYVDEGIGYIVELTGIEKSVALPLEQVKAQVTQDISQERAQKQVAALFASQDPELLKKELLAGNVKVVTVSTKPGKEHDKQFEQLRKDGVATDRMERMFQKKQSFAGASETMGYKVELIDVGPLNEELARKERSSVNSALAQANERQITYDFIASLREHAKIVMNRTLLKGL